MTNGGVVAITLGVTVIVAFSWAWWHVTGEQWPLRVHLAMNLGGFALGLSTIWMY